jgi:hypothetical protein
MSGRYTPTQAVNLLRREFSAMDAADRLTEAVRRNKCRLYCDGVVVPAHFRARLMVEPRLDPDGRCTADIVSAVREAWERPACEQVTIKEIVEGVEVFGEVVYREVVKTVTTKPPYEWEFDIDEVVALLPVRKGKKGANWEIHATIEMERLGRKAALDMHNSRQLRDHLKDVLEREINFVPKDPKALTAVITAFLRGDELSG